jgi:hypothetical protein
MQRCHHGHVKVTQQFEQMTAGSASENSEFMLEADNISPGDI